MFQVFDSFGYFDPTQAYFARDLSKTHGDKFILISTPMAPESAFVKGLFDEHKCRQFEAEGFDTILEQASLDTEIE